jgi:hypothetical protein
MPPVGTIVIAVLLVVVFFGLPQRPVGERRREKELKPTNGPKPWWQNR